MKDSELIIAANRKRLTDYKRFPDAFFQFFCYFWKEFSTEDLTLNWHIEYLCGELQEWCISIFENKEKDHDMVINMPPGETKSAICSVMLPAWVWAVNPKIIFITASCNIDLALALTAKSKDVISSENYKKLFPNVQIRSDADSKAYYKNTKGGSRYTTAVQAGVVGFHAHIKIIDDGNDPLKYLNPSLYDKDNAWVDGAFKSRNVSDKITKFLNLQQRVGVNDITGFLLSKPSMKIKHICLPATVEYTIKPAHLITNYKKGAMNNFRKPVAAIQKMLDDGTDPYFIDSQFGQDPLLRTGGLVKEEDFEIIYEIPEDFWLSPIHIVVDTSFKAKTNSDPVGIMVVASYRNDIYIIDYIVKRLKYSETKEEIITAYNKYAGSIENSAIHVELAATGDSVVEELKSSLPININGYEKPNDSKPARFAAKTIMIKSGRVKLIYDKLLGVNWIKAYLKQMTTFPFVKNDEAIDCTIMALDVAIIEYETFSQGREFREINF